MSDEKRAGGYTLVEDQGWVLTETETEPEPEAEEEEVDLETLTKAELIEMAEQAGLDTSGNKADLIDRLAE